MPDRSDIDIARQMRAQVKPDRNAESIVTRLVLTASGIGVLVVAFGLVSLARWVW